LLSGVVCQFLGGSDFNPCPIGFEMHERSCYRFVNISYSWAEAAVRKNYLTSETHRKDKNKLLEIKKYHSLTNTTPTHVLYWEIGSRW